MDLLYHLRVAEGRDSGWFYLMVYRTRQRLVLRTPSSIKGWKDKWFFVGGDWMSPPREDELIDRISPPTIFTSNYSKSSDLSFPELIVLILSDSLFLQKGEELSPTISSRNVTSSFCSYPKILDTGEI